MADTASILVIDQTSPLDIGTRNSKDALEIIRNYMNGAVGGNKRVNSIRVFADGTDNVYASGTVTIASGSGTVSITINGVAISRTWATSDTATATAFVTDINGSANALVKNHVAASSVAGVVTITAKAPGQWGNAVTLAAAGTGMTASGARLTSGAGADTAAVTISL
jgi:phage tail sheath gpL-like